MPVLHLSRKEHFNAAHRLWNKNWTEARNYEEFGVCANPNYHGHNFDLHVTVKGTPDEDSGCIINLKLLKKIIQEDIIEELDHKNLNVDVPWLADCVPSIENVIVAIWKRLEAKLPEDVKLFKLTLWETVNNYVEYYGE
jgi:6-pyruvoyltetrahydropterin/6-carboxytetrahydropterin synthase